MNLKPNAKDKKKTILIVDDEKAIIKLFESFFSPKGYRILSATSAEKAISLLEKETILVMFFDLNMQGINGVDLCRLVKKRQSVSIIYAITGFASLFDLAECRSAGFEDYFTKPVHITKLEKAALQAFEKLQRWQSI